MIFLQSLLYRLLYGALTRGRIRFGRGAVLLAPERIKITGDGSIVLGRGAVIDRGARLVVRDSVLRLEDGAYVGPHATLVAYADVTIGHGALIGERVSVHSEDHGPVGNRDMFCVSPVEIGPHSWICAGTVVSKGSVIGAGTTVGANSFVRGELPPGVLAVGAPARAVRSLTEPAPGSLGAPTTATGPASR